MHVLCTTLGGIQSSLNDDHTPEDDFPESSPIMSLPLAKKNSALMANEGGGGGLKAADNNSPSASNYSFLPSPETIQSIVTTSNKASANFFSKHVSEKLEPL